MTTENEVDTAPVRPCAVASCALPSASVLLKSERPRLLF